MKIKQRLVSGILSLAMLLPMVPTAFAGEAPDMSGAEWKAVSTPMGAMKTYVSKYHVAAKDGKLQILIANKPQGESGKDMSKRILAAVVYSKVTLGDSILNGTVFEEMKNDQTLIDGLNETAGLLPGAWDIALGEDAGLQNWITARDAAAGLVSAKPLAVGLATSLNSEDWGDACTELEMVYYSGGMDANGNLKRGSALSNLPKRETEYTMMLFCSGAGTGNSEACISTFDLSADGNYGTWIEQSKTSTAITLGTTSPQTYVPGGVAKPSVTVKAGNDTIPAANYTVTWYANKAGTGKADEPDTTKEITANKLNAGKYWATVAMGTTAAETYANPDPVAFTVNKATPHIATAPTYKTNETYYVGDSFPSAISAPVVQHSESVTTEVRGTWSFVKSPAVDGDAATAFEAASPTTVYPLFTPSEAFATNYESVVGDAVTFTTVKAAEQTVETEDSTSVDVSKGSTVTLKFQYKKNGVAQMTQNNNITVATTDTNSILEIAPNAVKSFDTKTGIYTVEVKVKADATTDQTATVLITAPMDDTLTAATLTFTIKAVDKITPFVTYNGADWKDDHYEKMHSANNALTVQEIRKTNAQGEVVTEAFTSGKYTVLYQSGDDWSDTAPSAPGKYKVRIEVTDSTLKDTYAQYSAETDYWIKGEVAKATGVKGETTTAGDLKITFTEPGNKTGIKNYTVKLFANNVTDFTGTPLATENVALNDAATAATFTVDGTTIKAGTSYKAVVVSNVVDADTDLYTAAASDVAAVSPKLATITVSVDNNSQTVAYGYSETVQYTITVTNTNNIAVKNATLPALDSNFEAALNTDVTSAFSLTANGSKSFVIKPKADLTAKTYTMFASGAKVTGDNIADTAVPTATLKVSVVQPQITVTAPSGNITAKFGSQHTIKFTTDVDTLLKDTDFTITTTGSGVKSADTKPTWNTDHWEFQVTLGDSANQSGQIKIQSKAVDGKFSASDAKTIDVTTTAKESITITVSSNGDYNGNPQPATIDTITNSITSDKYDIEYYHADGTEWTKTAPTNAGKHKVRIALKDATLEETYNKYSSEADFEITSAVISLSSLTFEKPYDGETTLSKLTEVKSGLTKETDGTYTIAGIGSEKVAVTEITGAFADATVGSGKSVLVSEFTLADYGTFKAANYKLELPETIGGSGTITTITAKVKLSTGPVEVSYNGTSLTIDDLASLVTNDGATTALDLKLSTVAGTLSLAWDATAKTFHDAANKITVTLYDSSYKQVETFSKFGSEKTYYADVAVEAMSDESNGFYTVKALPAQNVAPTAETLANYVTLKSTKENTGGGGGGGGGGASSVTSYTVTYKAGEHGKLSATSEKVEKDKYPSKVPTVTPDAGYRFLGWTMDGKTTVDPTSVKITKSVTFTALYEEGEAQPELPESTLEFDKENITGGYMNGYPDKTFGPMRNMTRAEVAAMISRVLTTHMEEGKDYDTGMYSDIKDSDWYRNSVGFLTENHVITGYTDGTFGGERTITRAEFIAMVIRVDGVLNGENPYSDVAASDWAYDYIVSGTQKGFIEGYPDGTFGGGRMITRAEATTLMNRVLGVNASNAEMPFSDVLPGFWAYGDINNAASR